MPPTLNKFQQNSCSHYSPTNYSTRYPLKEIQQQTIIQTNSLEVIDEYPNVYVTRCFKIKQEYNYKAWCQGYYLSCVKHTQRSCYLIPNGYMVGVKIYGIDTIAETQYDWLLVRLQNVESKKPKPFQYLDSVVYICDEFLITHNGYHQLAAIVSDIELQVGSLIPNGTYQSFKDTLHVIVSKLAYNDSLVLQIEGIIHIKLSGDGQQVGKHHNHIMFTACILNKHDAVLSPLN
ncbi:9547_t:CDS:2 [Dentiscutata erythropus]|uniref:9547_t:CDS:1 n=1 Tax=Dentiscutata erythropus TaxID=1348616 RepID=A0A9N9GNN7_9GLOM|nr:9547_t:CDS:2 [Dentiscutata erythropus]